MSAETVDNRKGERDDESSEGELSSAVIAPIIVQDGDTCMTATFPADAGRDLGISPGDTIVFRGEKGDTELTVGKLE